MEIQAASAVSAVAIAVPVHAPAIESSRETPSRRHALTPTATVANPAKMSDHHASGWTTTAGIMVAQMAISEKSDDALMVMAAAPQGCGLGRRPAGHGPRRASRPGTA